MRPSATTYAAPKIKANPAFALLTHFFVHYSVIKSGRNNVYFTTHILNMLNTCLIAVISILLCHGPQASNSRPSDLDTSVFSLDYDYDSEPYLPTSLGLKEAKMVDPWTLDFRQKLASSKTIGKSF